ncbi:ABC transporter substrate-binding protein [Actinomadura fibrosa]|uniref:PotD/PotF family extracellular solute-binding protein n=1 Tax=Actinomadura fibrosa TaxID=111802 RepID=A0ABW2XW18_9ACTN|nr:ABC transporter substrate-binding protein [Actinomadura fibrosa]
MGRRSALAAIGTVALLAATACGVDTADTGGSGKGGGELTVTVFSGPWQDLFEKSFVEPFEKETGAKVNLVPGANAEWLTKLRAAGGKNPPFDLVVLTPDAARPAVAGKLVKPLDTAKVSHWADLDPVQIEKNTVSGSSYGVPLTIGSTGLLYRTDKVGKAPADWQDIFSKEYCGHVALPPLTYNPGLEFFSALVTGQGGRLSNPADVDRAFNQLKRLKGCVSSYPANATAVQSAIQNGESWVVPYWDGRAIAMAQAGGKIGFTYPRSGAVGALSSYFVASGSAKSDLAYKFLGYITDPAHQKVFAEGNWYAGSNTRIDYSPAFKAKIKYGTDVYRKFNWVDYNVATPKLNEWQQRWNEIFR